MNIKQHVELKQKVYFDKHSLMAFQNTIILKAPKWYFLSVLYSWRGPTSGLTRCLKHACSPFQMPDMIDCRANSKAHSVKLQCFRFSPRLCEKFINFYSLKEHLLPLLHVVSNRISASQETSMAQKKRVKRVMLVFSTVRVQVSLDYTEEVA